jgi:Major capsid protein 13-like
MPATKLSDMVIPQGWADYVIEQTAVKSALWTSGLVESDERFNNACNSGGSVTNMPMFKSLTGRSELLSDITPLAVNKITTANEKAIVHQRGRLWGASQLSGSMAGIDPLGAIGSLIADWWGREFNTLVIQTLEGAFASATMATSVNNQGTVAITPQIVLDSIALLGDAADKLATMFVHSYTYFALQKLNLITFRRFSEQGEEIPYYLGKRVIVDDSCPYTGAGGTVTSYFAAEGAIAYGEASPDKSPVETDRDIGLGEDYLASRRKFILHPRGVSFIGTPAGVSPSDAEMQLGTNWSAVYEKKNIPLVKLITRVV